MSFLYKKDAQSDFAERLFILPAHATARSPWAVFGRKHVRFTKRHAGRRPGEPDIAVHRLPHAHAEAADRHIHRLCNEKPAAEERERLSSGVVVDVLSHGQQERVSAEL